MRIPRISSPGCGAVTLLLSCLFPVLCGCGASGGSSATSAEGNGVERAEARATEAEAEAQQLREQLSELEAQQAGTTAAPDDGGRAAAVEGATGAGGTILPAAARDGFAALARSLPGEVGLAVSPVGAGQPVEQLGSLQRAVAWSTSKVPVAMAAIDAGVGSSGDLRQAITASDNAAATNLWNALGGGSAAAEAANEELRAAGDATTAIESRTLRAGFTPFGQTSWGLADQVRFTAGLACLDAGGQLLGLMHETIAAQRWGLGSAGVPAELKGGWGPGSEPGVAGGYIDRQMGVMTIRGRPLAVTLLVRPSDGTHATGTSMLTRLAQWIAGNANVHGLPRHARC